MKPELLGPHALLMTFNPFYHMFEVVRGPLLGQIPSLGNYTAVAVMTILNFLFAAAIFVRFRSRISYWV